MDAEPASPGLVLPDAARWVEADFHRIVDALQQARAGAGPTLAFERSGVEVYVRFDKAASKLTMPFRFENQLAYELADVETGTRCEIHVAAELEDVYLPRIAGVLALLEDCLSRLRPMRRAWFSVALGDLELDGRSIAFSSAFGDGLLVPDPYFMLTSAYAREALAYAEAPPWDERIDQAYWRGAPSGLLNQTRVRDLPRVRLAAAARTAPAHFDVAVVAGRDVAPGVVAELEALGVLGDRQPQERMLAYRYQIDIDGFSNAWSGLFLKLLSGSPVLKVASAAGYRQWYYSRLLPWVHFVPVAADLSDLHAALETLRRLPDLARNIGATGRALATDLGYESQLRLGGSVLLSHTRAA